MIIITTSMELSFDFFSICQINTQTLISPYLLENVFSLQQNYEALYFTQSGSNRRIGQAKEQSP